ncbi:MAG: hypothetical protein WA101_01420 [Minisyncoccia bacterium]
MKPTKFSEIYFQPFEIFGKLLEKALPDCCIRKPRNKDWLDADLNIDKPAFNSNVIYVEEKAVICPNDDFQFMLSHDRIRYLKERETIILISWDNITPFDKTDIVNIYFKYNNLKIDGDNDPWLSDEAVSKIENLSHIYSSFTISNFDNKKFISKLDKFLKIKFNNDNEFKKWVKQNIEKWIARDENLLYCDQNKSDLEEI